MSIVKLLASDNYVLVNQKLMKSLGIAESVLFAKLANEYDYWEKENKLSDGYFPLTVEKIKNDIGMTAYQQRKAIEKLENLGIIETKLIGMPAKRYIKINGGKNG